MRGKSIITHSFVRVKCIGGFHMFDFASHLKTLRQSRNITQKQLAAAIHASERGVQNYEMGVRKPTYEMLIAIADYFDVSLDYLCGRSDNPTRL